LGRSRSIVYRLTALFSLDAFGGGFAIQSLIALWLFQRFEVSLSAVSIFYFCTSILKACRREAVPRYGYGDLADDLLGAHPRTW
jgi:hypothetical protein